MTFLAPALLWFLAVVSLPILIHLLNKKRHRTVRWAAMSFLLKATREARGKKKIRHILILATRALAIAAMVFAAAKPLASSFLSLNTGTINTVVLILDRSASMEQQVANGEPSKREIILQKVRNSMQQLDNPRLVVIDSATGELQEIASPDILPELSSSAATDSAADIPALAISALDYATGLEGKNEIWIASDLQKENWKPDDSRWLEFTERQNVLIKKNNVRILALLENRTTNIALRLLGTQRNNNKLTLDLELRRSADERGVTKLPITYSSGDATFTDSIEITGQSLRFQKTILLTDELESGHGFVKIPTDANPRDNEAFFAFGPSIPTKTLIVASRSEASQYLQLAAGPPGLNGKTATRVSPKEFSNTDLSDISTIIWMARFPSGNDQTYLGKFVNEGGQLVSFPTVEGSSEELFGLSWREMEAAPTGQNFLVTEWSENDGPLRDSSDGSPIPVEKLLAIQRMSPASDAAVLARWEDGNPFLTRNIIGTGTHWAVATIPDYSWSNLGDADVLLPLIQRIVQRGSERFSATYLSEVGSSDIREKAADVISLANSGRANPLTTAGIYRSNDRLLALNRPKSEDSEQTVGETDLDAFLGKNYSLFEQETRQSDEALATEMWPLFLIGVLLFLISEALLCLPRPIQPKVENGFAV